MTFEIQANPTTAEIAARLIPSWFKDMHQEAVDPRRLMHDYAYHLIGALQTPKTIKTVRKHTLAQWEFLQLLADEWPDVFDEFWTVYIERVIGS
ncbi:MAG: hypothetical protein U5N55_10835 [Cypionkella sp.]|nr:hypothetical protein [Cypionkella sp.]